MMLKQFVHGQKHGLLRFLLTIALLTYFALFSPTHMSQRNRSAISVESQSVANPLQMRCELISTNVEEKKLFIFMIRKRVKLKKKNYLKD